MKYQLISLAVLALIGSSSGTKTVSHKSMSDRAKEDEEISQGVSKKWSDVGYFQSKDKSD